ncbi:MAG: hypothetical protein KAR45_15885, partial [Desulfobacteraceae bacterium]|nr:hypothetical protein [Desulfobacteraceae bacterium]
MKNIITFIIIAILMFSVNTWAQQHIGLLKNVSGDVKIQRGKSFVVAHPGLQLMNTDIVITRDKGYAGIIFTDGT